MGELPAETFAPSAPAALAGAVAGDAMPNAIDAAELLDVDVDQFAGMGALVAAHRLGRIEVTHPAQPGTPQDPAYRGGRDASLLGDGLTTQLPAPQRDDLLDLRLGCRTVQPVRPRRAVDQPSYALGGEARDPFVDGLQADADADRNLGRPAPIGCHPHDPAASGGHSCGSSSGSSPRPLKLRNLNFLARDRMDNLLRAHI